VQVGKLFVSIKGYDPMTISEAQARELIEKKQEAERKKVIADFGKIRILNGPYGPYITDGKKNARIPKDTKSETITEAKAQRMLDEAPKPKGRRFVRKTA
jgi:DNA topoisomerase-1